MNLERLVDAAERRLQWRWRKALRRSMERGGGERLYRLGARACALYCGSRWVQRRFLRRRVNLIRRFVREADLNDLPWEIVIRRSLFTQLWRRWVGMRILREDAAADLRRRIVQIHGHEYVNARGEEGVIFVLAHAVFGRLIEPILEDIGFDPVTMIGARRRSTSLPPNLDFAEQMIRARRTLKRGGAVYMSPDGFFGDSGSRIPFHGRLRTFRPGFGELALATGARIVPVILELDMNGRLHVRFRPPLTPPDDSLERTARIADLIRQYVEFLDYAWKAFPYTIQHSHIRRHLDQAIP